MGRRRYHCPLPSPLLACSYTNNGMYLERYLFSRVPNSKFQGRCGVLYDTSRVLNCNFLLRLFARLDLESGRMKSIGYTCASQPVNRLIDQSNRVYTCSTRLHHPAFRIESCCTGLTAPWLAPRRAERRRETKNPSASSHSYIACHAPTCCACACTERTLTTNL